MSLSGLYYYFSSKEELLYLIQKASLDALFDRLLTALEDAEDPEERLRRLIRNHVRFFASNMEEMKVLSRELDSLTGEFRDEATLRMREYTGIARDVLEELAPGRGAAELRVSVFCLFGMMNWIYTWYDPERDVGVERLADEILRIFLRGYLPEPADAAAREAEDDQRRSLRRST